MAEDDDRLKVLRSVLGFDKKADAPEAATSAAPQRETKPWFTHPTPERELLLPEGTPPRPQRETTHEGAPDYKPQPDRGLVDGKMPQAAAPPDATGSPNIPGLVNPRIESWMNKDPLTWYPKESGEWTRWRKQLTNQELVEWDSKIRPLTARWHLLTRQMGNGITQNPEYMAYRKMYDDFMKRTVRRWREYEQRNPPRRYRPRMSAIEELGGIELG